MVSRINPWLIEAKVWAATASGLGIGLVVTVLNEMPGDASLMGSLPGWAQGILTLASPTVLGFLVPYLTRHTPRPDLLPPHVPYDPPAATPPVTGA